MGKKVLVVDDERLIVKGIKFSLVQDDMEVAENCLANKKRNMKGWKRNRLLREMSERISKYPELKKVIKKTRIRRYALRPLERADRILRRLH